MVETLPRKEPLSIPQLCGPWLVATNPSATVPLSLHDWPALSAINTHSPKHQPFNKKKKMFTSDRKQSNISPMWQIMIAWTGWQVDHRKTSPGLGVLQEEAYEGPSSEEILFSASRDVTSSDGCQWSASITVSGVSKFIHIMCPPVGWPGVSLLSSASVHHLLLTLSQLVVEWLIGVNYLHGPQTSRFLHFYKEL